MTAAKGAAQRAKPAAEKPVFDWQDPLRLEDQLSEEERKLILTYYGDRGSTRRPQRQLLAEQIRLSGTALRKRTQRIRERLKSKLVAAA